MQKWFIVIALFFFIACKDKTKDKTFEVKGRITNNPAKMIYLEEIPVATMQRMLLDSALLDKDGNYKLEAKTGEASVFNLRLDQNTYPLAAMVNDASRITVNASFNPANNQFAESYEVKGSAGSQEMKDFMFGFNSKLQSVFYMESRADSLRKTGAADSVLAGLENERTTTAAEIKKLTMDFIARYSNPAVTAFEVGYFQSTANNPAFKLTPLTDEEVAAVFSQLAVKFPDHQGIAAVKRSLDAQIQNTPVRIGKPAPEFSLPGVDGNEIALSSFRGKYLLVDFWASWCKPCRYENPNLVRVFNKYKDKNFTILGVSLDQPGKKEDWLNAIREDGLTWTHVSDLMFWQSPVVPLYRIEGIPYNVLLDPEGKVIASGLHGEALDAKLMETLK